MSQNFDIIAFNGVTGEFVTTADDSTRRLKENPPELELSPEQVEAIRQEHEPFLTQLEGLAVQAIAKGDWDDVYDFVNFHAPETEET